jgi:hypothetical protein
MPTITFTAQQFNALKNILAQIENEEYKWVQENYEDCEEEDDDTQETIVARLEENGAGDCTYADIQRVWSAINLSLCAPKIMTREAWEAKFGTFHKQTFLDDLVSDALYEDYVKTWKMEVPAGDSSESSDSSSSDSE